MYLEHAFSSGISRWCQRSAVNAVSCRKWRLFCCKKEKEPGQTPDGLRICRDSRAPFLVLMPEDRKTLFYFKLCWIREMSPNYNSSPYMLFIMVLTCFNAWRAWVYTEAITLYLKSQSENFKHILKSNRPFLYNRNSSHKLDEGLTR